MAVTADLTYKGVALSGIKFKVVESYHKQTSDANILVYQCTVTMPDGSVQGDTGWENVKSTSPDFTKSPSVDAEAQMITRLTAIGATNITTVEA